MTAVKLEDARRVISAAEKKATEIGQPMNIAVADEGGNIVAHVRMDNAWIGSIDISMKKAYTSRAFDIETKELAKHSQSGGEFFGIHVSNNGKTSPPSGWPEDFHLQTAEHARHTTKPLTRRTLRVLALKDSFVT